MGKYKEKQASSNATTVEETKKLLKERIQSLQQKNVDTPKVDGHGDVDIYNKPELSNLVNEDNESLIKGVPQTSPYVVSSSKKKRKRSNSDSATEEDISNIKASVEEPEFESLCAEIETLCVPTPNRPVPVFLTSGDRKKIKMSEDHVEDNLPTDESLESYDVARSVIYDL